MAEVGSFNPVFSTYLLMDFCLTSNDLPLPERLSILLLQVPLVPVIIRFFIIEPVIELVFSGLLFIRPFIFPVLSESRFPFF
jgi:hypothetical protein